MKKTALIMAGGSGERFWPKSRIDYPKQFLALTSDGKTMLQLTIERLLPLLDIQDIFIATSEQYRSIIRTQLPDLPISNILCEPVRRNTAPCIGLGAVHIQKKYKDEDVIMIVLPSDHLIRNNKLFLNALLNASDIAEQGENIVTMGIQPNYPETGYGYIKYNQNDKFNRGYRVERFVEKPCFQLAKQYIDSGDYFWNSGIFIWKISTILHQFRTYMNPTYLCLQNIYDSLGTEQENDCLFNEFQNCESISIDYGIMEKASDIFIVSDEFGWDDVGSWLAIERINECDGNNNILTGNVIAIDTKKCIIEGSSKLIATLGVEDLIIVDAKDAIMICQKDKSNDIKSILQELRNRKMDHLL